MKKPPTLPRPLPALTLFLVLLAACAPRGHLLGGAVSGLGPGKNLVLTEDVSGQTLTVRTDGAFTFPRRLPAGAAYRVVVAAHPEAQGCVVENGRGTASADVADVRVRCGDSGSLDTSFGSSGSTVTPLVSLQAQAKALAVLADGRLLAAGEKAGGGYPNLALARFDADGALDTSFGSAGRVVEDLGSTSRANALVVGDDGTVVVGGSVYGSDSDFLLIRYTAGGQRDSGFGSGGLVRTGFASGSHDYLRALLPLPDGRLLAGGRSGDDFALARYKTNGGLDSGFGTGGRVRTPMGSGGVGVYAMALQADGKVVAVGKQYSGGNAQFAVARYLPGGQLDTGFGGGSGYVLLDYAGKNDAAHAVALLPDGKIMVAGQVTDSSSHGFPALVRLNANGSLDASFGSGGWQVLSSAPTGALYALALQPDGKLLLAGNAPDTSLSYAAFLLARLLPGGGLDPGFGDGGLSITEFGGDAWIRALALQPDGRIVVAGYANGAGSEGFALARYWP
ncbi:delta-60 repeat domain-containing protein [Oceanithermus sp.]